jgi:hypothetical protein
MKRISSLFLYFGFVLILVSSLLKVLHMRDAGKTVVTVAFASYLVGLILLPFAKGDRRRIFYYYNTTVFPALRFFREAIWLGIIMVVGGILIRMLHFNDNGLLLISGLIIMIIAATALPIVYFIKRKPIPPSDIQLSASELDKYLGTYTNDQMKMEIAITRDGADLKGQATGQRSFPLSVVQENIFNSISSGIVIEFRPEKNEFILIQKGLYLPFIRQ